jgi:dipeptidyl aminopeptidase/acylaminoacyl peptidase
MLAEPQLDANARWRQRFRAPDVVWSRLAPANPARGLAITNTSGQYQLYAWDVPSGTLRQLTDRPTGTPFGELSGDGRYVYYLDDQEGNEIGHFVRLPYTGGVPQDLTPDLPPYSSWASSSSASGSHFGFMAADAKGVHIYGIETKASGEAGVARQLFHSRKLAMGPAFSHAGEIAVIATTERSTSLQYNLIAVDRAHGEPLAELWDGPGTSVEATLFSPRAGDLRMAGTTNRSGVKRPLIWNPSTGERMDLDLPDLDGEVFPVDWSADGRRLLLCQFAQAVQQLYLYDLATQTLTRLNHPGGTFEFQAGSCTYFGPGGEILAGWQDAAHPMQLIALDASTGEKTRTVLAAGEVPPCRPWQSITFPSSDGQAIQGWLGLPEGQGPFPIILHTHGGPTSVMTDAFSPASQMWMDHGFAFLTINYRGSTTFGREFMEKIWGNIGYWEMEDVAAAHRWLVKEGIAQPDAILLTGRSYGGYNTLMGLSKWPDLWAGGMAVVAIADWAMTYEDAADTLKGYDAALFGGTPQEKPDAYRASSPITYAEQLQAPLLIIQGRNDTRTPSRQMEVYEQKLRALGRPLEMHWYDAGHSGAGVEGDIQDGEVMLQFAHRVLG